MKTSDEIRTRFKSVISGRANIFSLFFQSGLEALKPGGVLAYVVPPSMNVGAYFKALRQYISDGNAVEYLKVFTASDLFQDAQTSVQIIVIRKGGGENSHVLKLRIAGREEPMLFENPKEIQEILAHSHSLWDLGYEATTGTVVWNKFKDELKNDQEEGFIPLYYPRNLSDGALRLRVDERKPQYLSSLRAKHTSGPAILVNRILGGVGKGQISAAILPTPTTFYAENHLNIIRAREGQAQKVSLTTLYEMISSPETLKAARLITGNTQLSATEWNFLIPFSQK
jgi:adenine-specific DNA-methyltransferase